MKGKENEQERGKEVEAEIKKERKRIGEILE